MEVAAKGNILGGLIPARYILAVLGCIGMAIIYGLRVNISVALVGMVNHTALNGSGTSNHLESAQDGPFLWASEIQGLILSCYFWGYFISQLPGGRMAELFSAKWVMFSSVAINVVCTLLSPVMANTHYIGLMVMRFLDGLGAGMAFPSMHVLLSKWAPTSERSFMSALVYAGTSLGTVISMFMAGMLTATVGWASVFYVMGGLSLIWCILWVVLVQDSPLQQPFISIEERNMIGTIFEGKKLPVPWRDILTSPPFMAILITHVCSNWGSYMLVIELPSYMKQVLRFKMSENAVVSATPFLMMWFFSMGFSKLIDKMRARKSITTTTARKISTFFASVVPAGCFFSVCFIGDNREAAVAIMTLGVTFMGAVFSGFIINHIDIAPNFAGTLMGVTNTVATIPGIVVPIFVREVTRNDQSINTWRIVFFVTSGMLLIEIIVYGAFGSGEEQPWNKASERSEIVN